MNNDLSAPRRKPHVLILMKDLAMGGITTVVKNDLAPLYELGVEVTIAVRLEREWVDDSLLQMIRTGRFLQLPNNIEEAKDTLVNYVNLEGVDCVIGMTVIEDLHSFARVIKKKTNAKVASWYHTRLYYLWDLDLNKVRRGGVKEILKFCVKLPIVHILGLRNNLRKKYQYMLRNYDYFIVLCEEYKYELIRSLRLSDTEANKIVVLINTIDINESPTLDKDNEVVFVGRLQNYDKRVDDLLLAWSMIASSVSSWRLSLYGHGPDEAKLRALVDHHRIPNVFFKGYTSDVQSIYDRAQILCLTSVFEGWPMALVEAQNNGVIPVSYDCAAGVRAIIGSDEEAGRLVHNGKVKEFARTLLELIQNEEQRKRLQAGALQKRYEYSHEVNNAAWRLLLGL